MQSTFALVTDLQVDYDFVDTFSKLFNATGKPASAADFMYCKYTWQAMLRCLVLVTGLDQISHVL